MTAVDPHFYVIADCTYPATCPPPATATTTDTVTATSLIPPAVESRAGGLPVTGADLGPFAAAGAALLIVGAVMARRNRKNPTKGTVQ